MSVTKEQLEEAWSWIHNERRCVTVQTVSLSMGMSRSDASALLAQLPSFKPGDYSYECTKCVLTQKDDKTGECSVFFICKRHAKKQIVLTARVIFNVFLIVLSV